MTQNIEAVKTKMQTIFYNLDMKNNICADCGKKKSMDYASINNGIIICEQCAKEHLALGYNISFLHSLGEKWDDYLFNYIKVGGNSRFLQFCKDYKLDKHNNNNIMQKYKSKGLVYYRDILRSEVLGYDPPENINVNKAYEEEKEIPDNYPEFKKYSFVKHVDMNYLEKKFYIKKEEKEEGGLFGKIGDFFGNVKKNIENLEIVKKVQEIDIKDVKQKGADMFGYFFFGSNNKENKENKEEEKKEKNINIIDDDDKKEDNIIMDNNDKNNEFKNLFGIDMKRNNNEEIKDNNNKNILLNNEESKNEIGEKKDSMEYIKESEDKIEIKEEMTILSDDANNKPKIEENSEKEKNQNMENNNSIKENEIEKKDETENNKENGNENAIDEILHDDDLNKDNTKMNNEEKDELEKMLQE